MDVSVIGASGDVGRYLVRRVVHDRLLDSTQRLQLVASPRGESVLRGMAADLREAYSDTAPEIDIATSPEEVVGDIVVMVAGGAPAAGGRPKTRDELAPLNRPIFDVFARAIARRGSGDEVVVIVSNPVELGVSLFARHLGRQRVLGMGAHNDTIRFRRELAASLGVRRQNVHGFVAGEHGDLMVPLWSSVKVYGFDDDELAERVRGLRASPSPRDFTGRLRQEQAALLDLIGAGRVAEAYARVETLSPDLRAALRPYVTHYSGAKTVASSVEAALDLVRSLMDGREVAAAANVALEGEFHGVWGPCGAPVMIGKGVESVIPLEICSEEASLLRERQKEVNARLARWETLA